MKTLIIVESPAKATTIQKYLGDDYIVLASYGHICDLAKGSHYGIGVDVKNDFKPHYLLMDDKKVILQNIIDAAEKVDQIILCSDMDIEGESISFHLKRYLTSSNKPIKRATFIEITKAGIEEGLKNLRDIDQNLCNAQQTRRILDRIVGFTTSPFLMNFFDDNSLSSGRVQSVAVRMIVDREKEIEGFKPEEYWNLFVKFSNDKGQEFLSKLEEKPRSEKEALETKEIISNLSDFFVDKVSTQKRKEKPLPPLTTAKLQQAAAKILKFDADKTMKAAQSLYENGYCTYIRTDSTRISDEALKSARKYLKENNFDVPASANVYAAKKNAQDAHECIRPTNVSTKAEGSLLTGDEKLVYDIIWKYFLASQMQPAIYNILSVNIKSKSNNKINLKISGKALSYKGYLEMISDAELSEITIPLLEKNEQINFVSCNTNQKFTTPPSRFNDASINEELENKHICRPSTFAETIKKITARNYVEKSGNTYRPTMTGRKVIDTLVSYFKFMEYNFTADLENKLDDIAAGKQQYLNVLKDFYDLFSKELFKAYLETSKDKIHCKKCNEIMLQKNGKFGKFNACINLCCKNIETVDIVKIGV